MKIKINFFKKSSKWYTEETLVIPEKFRDEINDMRYYEVRKWVEQKIRENSLSDEMTAVCIDDEIIGFPMMIYPRGVSLC